jgi:hypothetical protein
MFDQAQIPVEVIPTPLEIMERLGQLAKTPRQESKRAKIALLIQLLQ